MKTLTTLLLTIFLVLACNGQTPGINQCFNCYTQAQWDSLTVAKDNVINQQADAIASQQVEIAVLRNQNDALQRGLNECMNPTDTLVYLHDKVSIKLEGDSTHVELYKSGDIFNYQLTRGQNRVNIFYDANNNVRYYYMYGAESYDSGIKKLSKPLP